VQAVKPGAFRWIAVAFAAAAITILAAAAAGPTPDDANAASHREAPLISLDPAADISDFFMFRSYEPGKDDKVVLLMDVFPGEEPSAGPNYYNFDPSVVYQFGIDNNMDGKAEDVRFEFRFDNEIRGVVDALGLPLSYVGGVPPATGSVIPPITALDGPGSEGLGLRQRYSVTMTKKESGGSFSRQTLAEGLIAVPSNVGPRTMPNYPALAAQGIRDLGNGVRVFAGQRQDPFYIDLGAVFDTLNLRRTPPLLTAAEDASDNTNPFGVDMLSGFSVHTIALEVPAAMLTADGRGAEQTAQPKLGAYAHTSRPVMTTRRTVSAATRPVQRLANPLVNELIIGTKDKDRWNATDPESEGQFLDYYLKPRLALAFELIFGFPTGCVQPFGGPTCEPDPPGSQPFASWNRTDLVNILLKYAPSDPQLSELLRLDVSVDPTPLASQRRMTILAGDNAGWPNGRRPKDDVTDIAIRVVGGPNYLTNRAGDGVNTDDAALTAEFPFLATPADGRNRQPTPHINP
jgi:hypothetical protein